MLSFDLHFHANLNHSQVINSNTHYFSYSVQWKMFHLAEAENRQLTAVKTLSKNSVIDSFIVVAQKNKPVQAEIEIFF
jgi:hypothetical protein